MSRPSDRARPPRAGLSTGKVVRTALDLLDDGAELTLSSVAARLGVATPSLYKHVKGLEHLRELVAERCLRDMTATLGRAAVGRSGPDAVAALLHAYRDYVLTHPHRYAAIPRDPLSRPVLAAAGQAQLDLCATALRSFHLEQDELIHQLRLLRAAVHGFASLEAAGGFGLPQDVDESFTRLVQLHLAELTRRTEPS